MTNQIKLPKEWSSESRGIRHITEGILEDINTLIEEDPSLDALIPDPDGENDEAVFTALGEVTWAMMKLVASSLLDRDIEGLLESE